MGDEVRVTVIAAGFDRWDDERAEKAAGGALPGTAPAPPRRVGPPTSRRSRRLRHRRRRGRPRRRRRLRRPVLPEVAGTVTAVTRPLHDLRPRHGGAASRPARPTVIVRTDRWSTGIEVRHGTTSRADGDFAIDGDPRASRARRAAASTCPWVWLRQVHGAEVHRVAAAARATRWRPGRRRPGQHRRRRRRSPSRRPTACPVAFSSPEGVIGVAHAGWRGIEAGVLQATVTAMADARRLGRSGPASGPASTPSATSSVPTTSIASWRRFGPPRRAPHHRRAARARHGRCRRAGARPGRGRGAGDRDRRARRADADAWYSHRARGDAGRMATVVWRDGPAAASRDDGTGARSVGRGGRTPRGPRPHRRAPAATPRDRLVAVTKGFGPEVVRSAIEAGLDDLGENYAQELVAKVSRARRAPSRRPVRWHFLGRLQTNKVRHVAPSLALWQTRRSPRPGRARSPTGAGRRDPGADQPVRRGPEGRLRPERRAGTGRRPATRASTSRGSWGSAPAGPPEARVPGSSSSSPSPTSSSCPSARIGMSGDLEVAVAEGATMVRIGRGLFGASARHLHR